MKALIHLLLTISCVLWQGVSLADGNPDLIPELKDIEKVAADQEAAIRAQTDALLKAQKEKENAEKAAAQAIEQQKAAATQSPAPATQSPSAPATVAKKHAPKKVAAIPKPEKVDPWLAQERRYTFP